VEAQSAPIETLPAASAQAVEFDMLPNDPLLAYLLSVSSVVEINKLHLESPTLAMLKEAGVQIVVPLISQGELIGLLNLGPRRSEQDYSADDRRLLNTLAAQAAPALRVAQLARQQQSEARERERLAQEMRVARVIQQTLLPKEIPALPGWQMAAHWQPARAVSGDFYDFIEFPDGKLAIIVGDVTDKGVPAALVMATTRSVLRAAAERLVSPGAVLEHANNTLCPDIPSNMFVTCLYALLDPRTGELRYANAGHNLPYQRTAQGVVELRARGMPLGLMPEMPYEEKETRLEAGDQIVFYSDGLVEAHNPQGEIFGFPRLRELLAGAVCTNELIFCMVEALRAFTGPDWEQEDDVTFVSMARDEQAGEGQRPQASPGSEVPPAIEKASLPVDVDRGGTRRLLASFNIASQPGNERVAMVKVAAAVSDLNLPALALERLKTAVAEATMNAMEHGNRFQAGLPVEIEVLLDRSTAAGQDLIVCIRDHGGGQEIPESEMPDLDAKLAGLQSPRGWGLFLIKKMVDEMRVSTDETHHTIELVLHLEGDNQ
jgi:serine phosphatase RsbU (regulator of sigma subunit)/anti-sigma regulatory factor (Ser/Thr protein kinase)